MSFNPFAFLTQPLVLTVAQILGVAPQVDIPTTPPSNGTSFSSTQKAALLAVGVASGAAVAGTAIVADKLSNQRITITELNEEPKGSLEKLEDFAKRNKKGLNTLGALGLFGAILGIGALSQGTTTEAPPPPIGGTVAPLATGQWYTPPASQSTGGIGGFTSGYIFAEP